MPAADRERAFVEPTITPEASLTEVTLLSGGIGRHKPGNDTNGHRHGGSNSSPHGHGGHGH